MDIIVFGLKNYQINKNEKQKFVKLFLGRGGTGRSFLHTHFVCLLENRLSNKLFLIYFGNKQFLRMKTLNILNNASKFH